ncbi:MAG TPA: D-tyrosyl-tRNA(Tyr) deacylase [Candidatus Fimimorpha excrementavium]|nr:D-tyrosyl-tRNA(Tyr) deacylase [Candidatus Fimimorpha excrementavium]
MKLVIQRVNYGSVTVDGNVISEIGKGFVVLFGAGEGDTEEMADRFADKMIKLRIFEDENGKTNCSLADVKGELLIISQFTLYADCRKGNRPSFIHACEPKRAEELYEYFLERCRERYGSVKEGIFGADMKVRLENDGPFTIVMDSEEWKH